MPTAIHVMHLNLHRNRRLLFEGSAWVLLSAAIVCFYCWTATSSRVPFDWRLQETNDHFNLLTDGFLAGKLHLLVEPAPELLALKNPWDPVTNAPYRLLDATLYKGRYYLYFGPCPVVMLYLPWRLLTGAPIPPSLADVLLLTAGYVFSCLLLLLLLKASNVRPHWLLKGIACASLGLAQISPMVLRRAAVYEVSLAASFCFFLGGMYFLARRLLKEDSSPALTLLAGALIALTPGCRPHFAVVAIVLWVIFVLHLVLSRHWRGRVLLREIVLFSVPIGVSGLLLLWYNFARFGDPLEFGLKYVLSAREADFHASLSLDNLLPGLYYFLLLGIEFIGRFPYMKFYFPKAPFGHYDWLSPDYFQEQVAGLFSLTPLYVAGVLAPLFLVWRKRWATPQISVVVAMLYTSAVTLLVCVCLTGWVSMRYSLDFAPLFLLLSLFFLLLLIERADSRWARSALIAFFAAGCAWGSLTSVALSINGYANALDEQNPRLFSRLATVFGQKPQSQRLVIDTLSIHGKMTFPNGLRDRVEVLLRSGGMDARNVIYLDFIGTNEVKCRYDRFGMGGPSGPIVRIVPGRVYDLHVDYTNAERRLVVRLGDITMLDHPTEFYPTAREEVIVGRDGFGGLFGAHRFAPNLNLVKYKLTFLPGRWWRPDYSDSVWNHGVRPGGSEGAVLFSGANEGPRRIEPGDALVFEGSGRRSVVSVDSDRTRSQILVNGPLDAESDGFPHEIEVLP